VHLTINLTVQESNKQKILPSKLHATSQIWWTG